jgi:arginase family enzyme
MRLVPIMFPSDLGRSDRGVYRERGERGAPDIFLDTLEGEGVRFARPVIVPVEVPTEPDPEDAPLKFDALNARAVQALALAVEDVNAAADFPLVLGGDQTALCGHVLGHSIRHPEGIGLAVLADSHTDLATPAKPVYDDKALFKDQEVTHSGDLHRMVTAACLRMIPEEFEFGKVMQKSALQASQTSTAGVRARDWAQVKKNEKIAKIQVWRMERLEFDGESTYRSMLTRHLSEGPIILSIDASGLDPDMMTAVTEPLPDGIEWSFLKKTLEQCLPHLPRILGIDISELDPTRDDAHKGSILRFAETLAPFLKKLTR